MFHKIMRAILRMIIAGLLIILLFLIYIKAYNIDIIGIDWTEMNIDKFVKTFHPSEEVRKGKPDNFVISYNQRANPYFFISKNYLVMITTDYIKWIDIYGKEVKFEQLSLSRVLARASGDYIAVCETNGTKFYVINGLNILENTIENSIINIDINKSGFLSVITQISGYRGVAYIYDSEGDIRFERSLANDFILDAHVFPKNDEVLINRIDTSEMVIKTFLEFIRINETKPYSSVQITDSLITYADICSNLNVFAVGEDCVYIYNSKHEEILNKPYSKIISVSKNNNGLYYVIGEELNNEQKPSGLNTLVIINEKGEIKKSIQLALNATTVYATPDMYVVAYGAEAVVYNNDGVQTYRYQSGDIIENILIWQKNLVVVTRTSTTKISSEEGTL